MKSVTVEINLRIMDTIEIEDDKVEAAINYDLSEEGKRTFAHGVKELLNVDHVEVTKVKHFVLGK